MARAVSKRVKLNLAALDQLQFAVAVGMERLALEIVEEAAPKAPDSTGRGTIAKTGGHVVLNGSRKVGGTASKPRSFDTRRRGIISAVAGFGSPLAHLHERGTVGRTQDESGRFTGVLPPRPFLLPATTHVVKSMGPVIGAAIKEAGFSKPGGAA